MAYYLVTTEAFGGNQAVIIVNHIVQANDSVAAIHAAHPAAPPVNVSVRELRNFINAANAGANVPRGVEVVFDVPK